jgi:hypothetical protein
MIGKQRSTLNQNLIGNTIFRTQVNTFQQGFDISRKSFQMISREDC